MKKRKFVILATFLSFVFMYFTAAANAGDIIQAELFFDGGEYQLSKTHIPHLTTEQRDTIQKRIDANTTSLSTQGVLDTPYFIQQVSLEWPLQCLSYDSGCHGISNFVDHNPSTPDALLDYYCGERTYDTDSGYNHRGIDYFNWPFSWYKMDHEQVAIVAAAPGIIIGKDDGNFDRECKVGGGMWNAVYVRHADGSTAWYGHMKNGSLTTKEVGQSVTTGEFLGIVGSSGNSTGPHLHFELYDSDGALIDPYYGSCNSLNITSWWLQQRPYYDSAINLVASHNSPPEFNTCPTQESPNFQDNFQPGDRIYLASYYRDQLAGQVSTYSIYRPDDSTFYSWQHSISESHYAASYWYSWFNLPDDAPVGVWTYVVDYEGESYTHTFNVVGNKFCSLFGTVTDKDTGNPINKAKVVLKKCKRCKDKTDNQGYYEINDVECGIYKKLLVKKKGYKVYKEKKIEIEDDIVRDVQLKNK
ncbi:MAG: peptidoglycan DD-metalloendopeptidase family protein [Pseudomonadota bacterium]